MLVGLLFLKTISEEWPVVGYPFALRRVTIFCEVYTIINLLFSGKRRNEH